MMVAVVEVEADGPSERLVSSFPNFSFLAASLLLLFRDLVFLLNCVLTALRVAMVADSGGMAATSLVLIDWAREVNFTRLGCSALEVNEGRREGLELAKALATLVPKSSCSAVPGRRHSAASRVGSEEEERATPSAGIGGGGAEEVGLGRRDCNPRCR